MRKAAGDSVTLFWNGNSIRKSWKDGGFKKIVNDTMADHIFFIEAKCGIHQLPVDLKHFLVSEGYLHHYEHVSQKEPAKWGYAGIICFSKVQAAKVLKGIDHPELDIEGRALTLFFNDQAISGVYFPNSGKPGELMYMGKKILFMDEYDKFLDRIIPIGFPVLVGGDTNVARKTIDVFDRTDSPWNKHAPSCTVEEQKAFQKSPPTRQS